MVPFALLVRRETVSSVYQGAPHNECSGAGLHEKYVHLSFVPTRPDRRPPGETNKKGFTGKIRELLYGKMMWISGSFGTKAPCRACCRLAGRPMPRNPCGTGFLGSPQLGKESQSKNTNPELFSSCFSPSDFVVTLRTKISHCTEGPLVTKTMWKQSA